MFAWRRRRRRVANTLWNMDKLVQLGLQKSHRKIYHRHERVIILPEDEVITLARK